MFLFYTTQKKHPIALVHNGVNPYNPLYITQLLLRDVYRGAL